MPLTKQAIKKMYHDRRVTKHNESIASVTKKTIKKYRKNPKAQNLSEIFSLLDKNVKTRIIHKNKASRLKSRLSRLQIQETTA